jgi:hypothetical protein
LSDTFIPPRRIVPPSGIGIEVRTFCTSTSGSWIVTEFWLPSVVVTSRIGPLQVRDRRTQLEGDEPAIGRHDRPHVEDDAVLDDVDDRVGDRGALRRSRR